MAKPARHGLRAARRSGLTSPDPVRTHHAPDGHPNPRPRARKPGQAAGQASGRTPMLGFISENSSCRNRTGTAYRNRPVDRGLGDPAFVPAIRGSAT